MLTLTVSKNSGKSSARSSESGTIPGSDDYGYSLGIYNRTNKETLSRLRERFLCFFISLQTGYQRAYFSNS